MKANVSLEIDKEDLNYELRELVREIAGEEVRRMVRTQAQSMVEQEVKRIVAPIVDEYLQDAQVGREHISYHDKGPRRGRVDDFIKRIIKDYLDEPVYIYSKLSEKISERYHVASNRDRTRAELWVIQKSIEFVDKNVFPALEERIKEVAEVIVPSEEKIQELIRTEVLKKFV